MKNFFTLLIVFIIMSIAYFVGHYFSGLTLVFFTIIFLIVGYYLEEIIYFILKLFR